MNTPVSPTPWWLWAGPIGSAAVLAVIGYGPTRSAAGREGVIGMAAGQLAVLVVVYATLAGLVGRIGRAPAAQRLQLALRAGVLRFFITIVVSAVLVLRFALPAGPLLIWVAISYVVIVQVETIALVRWMATLEKRL